MQNKEEYAKTIQNEHNYLLSIDLKDDKLIINIKNTLHKPMMSYEKSYSYDDISKIDKVFKLYDSIQDCYDDLKDLFQKDKYDIIIDNECLILVLIYNYNQNERRIQLKLPMIIYNQQEIINDLCLTLSKLTTKQNQLQADNNACKNRLEKLEKVFQSMLSFPIRNDIFTSLIQTEYEYNLIRKWINKNDYESIDLKMIFKGSINSFNSGWFYHRYENTTPLLFVIQIDKNVKIGGYITNPLHSDGEFREDKDAFIFSLKRMKKFIPRNSQRAIYLRHDFFCHFGEDLVIYNQCNNTNSNYSYFPRDYGTNLDFISDFTDGKKTFEVKEIEIYTIK